MSQNRKQVRENGSRQGSTSIDGAHSLDSDDDANDADLLEAIRLSKNEYLTTADSWEREAMDLEKAIQLSLIASTSGDSSAEDLDSSVARFQGRKVSPDEKVCNCGFNLPENCEPVPSSSRNVPTTSFRPKSECICKLSDEATPSTSNQRKFGSLKEIEDSNDENGPDSNSRRRKKSLASENGDTELKVDANGCDSTVRRGRGRGRGRNVARGGKISNGAESSQQGEPEASSQNTGRGRGRGRALRSSVSQPVILISSSDQEDEENEIEAQVRAVFPTFNDDDRDADVIYLSEDLQSSSDECSSTTQDNAFRPQQTSEPLLSNSEVATRMRTLFEKSLQLHLNGDYLRACDAVNTPLYPHQMYALAWMSNRENSKNLGMKGGILADDMGLGKTLSILALILTNFHDGKPMAKPQAYFKRQLPRSALRYMPESIDIQPLTKQKQSLRPNGKSKQKSSSAFEMFDNLSKKVGGIKRSNKRQKQLIDSSDDSSSEDDTKNDSIAFANSANFEEDEFDAMLKVERLSDKLNSTASASTSQSTPKQSKFFDGLSDDEDYQNMSKEERDRLFMPKSDREKNLDGFLELPSSDDESCMNPRLNVDGAGSSDDTDSDFEQPCSSSGTSRNFKRKNKNHNLPAPSLKRSRQNSPSLLDEDPIDSGQSGFELPDIDEYDGNGDNQNSSLIASQSVELTPQQLKKLREPPKEVAKLNGRRKATLIVTPASLIGQWLSQIELHISKKVDIDVFVHHGASKALIALELQDKHIVLTTYGTLMAEFKEEMHGPLLRAKWLRVVLDEGHLIKNHLAKTFKAAKNLDTERKWIVSGTPIQNNLTELWALLNWLDEPNYSDNRPLFKLQIENAIKRGHPRGVERLQVLMEAICLRRTKSDQIDGKPLVLLPAKTVRLKELDFTQEEKIVYDAYHKKGKELILKYMKRGTLLRNYAHVFAVMMRLRQLCCHKELLPVKWNEVDLNELTALATEEIEADGGSDGSLSSDVAKRLADQLRNMIKDGMSDECSICLSEFEHPVITPCAHVYCRNCITQHIESVPPPAACPLCRGVIKISLLLEAARDEENEEASDEFEDIVVETSSTKVMAVMQELELCRRKNRNEKVIICSQFTSLLSIFQPLLTDAGYEWTRLDGSMNVRDRLSVITKFQSEKKNSPKVLLLSLRAGGVGLNLTAANRLFLLDPAWNPSTEEQCFDRIHRLGQTKDVEIVKFVMKDSIEQRMLSIQDKKRDLISGAFRQTENERREQRIQDIRDIFGI